MPSLRLRLHAIRSLEGCSAPDGEVARLLDVGNGESIVNSVGTIIDVLEDPAATHADLEAAKNLAEVIDEGEFPIEPSIGKSLWNGAAARTLRQADTPASKGEGGRQVAEVKQVVID